MRIASGVTPYAINTTRYTGAPRTNRLIHFFSVSVHSGKTNLDIVPYWGFHTTCHHFARLRPHNLWRRSSQRSVASMHGSHVSSETWLWQIVRVLARAGGATIHRTCVGVDRSRGPST